MSKIRVATIGTNFIVDSFVAGARHDERFEYAAVYSRTAEQGSAFASKYGVEKIYTSLEKLAAATDIDAVYVASPNICHATQAIMMMDAGKHVMCEKPLAPTAKEAEAMFAAARRNGVALLEAMKTTLLPNFAAVRAALPRIGTVRRFIAQFCQYSSRYDRFKKGDVCNAFNPKMAGGSIRDLGVYGIAPMVHLFGVPWEGKFTPEKLAEKVKVNSTMILPGGCDDPARSIDGQGVLTADYGSMQAVVTYSKITDSSAATEIQGEDGTILISKLSTMVAPKIVFRHGSGSRADSGFHSDVLGTALTEGEEDISVETVSDNMYYEVKEFFDMIESGRIESEENTFERSLQVIQLCSASGN